MLLILFNLSLFLIFVLPYFKLSCYHYCFLFTIQWLSHTITSLSRSCFFLLSIYVNKCWSLASGSGHILCLKSFLEWNHNPQSLLLYRIQYIFYFYPLLCGYVSLEQRISCFSLYAGQKSYLQIINKLPETAKSYYFLFLRIAN